MPSQSKARIASESLEVEHVEGTLVALEDGAAKTKLEAVPVAPVVAVAAPPPQRVAWGAAAAFLFVGGLALGILLGTTGGGGESGGGGAAAATEDKAERGMAYFAASIELASFASCEAIVESRDAARRRPRPASLA